jgi:predicted small lipoprotein YifL
MDGKNQTKCSWSIMYCRFIAINCPKYKSLSTKLLALGVLSSALMLMTACGQKGPLIMPDPVPETIPATDKTEQTTSTPKNTKAESTRSATDLQAP